MNRVIVPGEGPSNATIALIGEAPGREEIQVQRPFVGKSGQLLDLILKEVGLKRSGLYIDNVYNSLPLDEYAQIRMPTPVEIAEGGKVLITALEKVKPKVIIALGKVATTFLKSGQFKDLKIFSSPLFNFRHSVISTVHPAAVIRDEFWSRYEDILSTLHFTKFVLASYPEEFEKEFEIIIPEEKDLKDVFDEILSTPWVSFDVETQITDKGIIGLGIAVSAYKAYYFPLYTKVLFSEIREPYYSNFEYLNTRIKEFATSNIAKAAQNAKSDMAWIEDDFGVRVNRVEYDTMEMARLYYNNLKRRDLATLTTLLRPTRAGWKGEMAKFMKEATSAFDTINIDVEDMANYCGQDCLNTYWIADLLRNIL